MERAENQATSFAQAVTYRDGLIIVVLATHLLRRRNLAGLVIGKTVVREGTAWWIRVPGLETKNGDPIEAPWPDDLVSNLELYLSEYRPRFACSGSALASEALWISKRGTPLTSSGLYQIIIARTRERLGRPISPHQFRHSAVTSIAIDDPVHIGIASRLLGHRSNSTVERYYNHARSIEAARLVQTHILTLRSIRATWIERPEEPTQLHIVPSQTAFSSSGWTRSTWPTPSDVASS